MSYAPAALRPALAALFALDDRLGAIVRTTREPIVGQMRLTWWHEALVALDTAPPPAEPVLRALHAEVVARGVSGAALAAMVDGWEVLIDGTPDDAAIIRMAADRGGRLFAAASELLGAAGPQIAAAGEGWALADLAMHRRDPGRASRARALAAEALARAFAGRWPRAARPLGMLALLARDDLAAIRPRRGSPRRLARLLMHRIWGR